MVWSHNDSWMVTGDHSGYVKYWQSNMNNVKMFQAHKEAIRGIRYSLTYIFYILIILPLFICLIQQQQQKVSKVDQENNKIKIKS